MQGSKVKIQQIEINKIKEPEHSIRREMDIEHIRELAESIRKVGMIQPIVVRERNGSFEIVAGHSRYLAAKYNGSKTIDAIVTTAEDDETMQLRVHENLFRKNLSPLEEAEIVAWLHEKRGMELTEIATLCGKSRQWVEERITILGYDPELKEALHKGKVSLTVAKTLMRVDDENERAYLIKCAIEHGASASTVMGWVNDYNLRKVATYQPGGTPSSPGTTIEPILPKMACWICNQQLPYADLLHRWVCPQCVTEIQLTLARENQKNT